MNRQDFYRILEKYPRFVLRENLKPKQVKNIMEHVIPYEQEDRLLAFFDKSLFDNGKTGIAITTQAIYDSNEKVNVPYIGVQTIKHYVHNKGTHREIQTYKVIYTDGKTIEYNLWYPDGSELFRLILELSKAVLEEQKMKEASLLEAAKPQVELTKPQMEDEPFLKNVPKSDERSAKPESKITEPVTAQPVKEAPKASAPATQKQKEAVKKTFVTDEKMSFAWDLGRVNSNSDERNPIEMKERTSLLEWEKKLKSTGVYKTDAFFEPLDAYEDDLLEYVARVSYRSMKITQALKAYRAYIDRHDDITYDFPKEVREYADTTKIILDKEDICYEHLKDAYEVVRDYGFAKRHPEAVKDMQKKNEPRAKEASTTSIFRDYMVVDQNQCIGCGACVDQFCEAIYFDEITKTAKIKPELCEQCGECMFSCPVDAIS